MTICIYDNMYIWQYVYMTICIYDNMYIWQYVYMTICIYDNMYIWQYIYIYMTYYVFFWMFHAWEWSVKLSQRYWSCRGELLWAFLSTRSPDRRRNFLLVPLGLVGSSHWVALWKTLLKMGLSENVVYPYTQWLMIIIPTKWLFHWGYTPFSDIPKCLKANRRSPQVLSKLFAKLPQSMLRWTNGCGSKWKT